MDPMVFIIAGGIDSGKTARLKSAYASLPSGTCRGFLSVKSYSDGQFTGYDLFELGTGATRPLARLTSLYRRQFAKPFVFDRFTFDQSAFDYGCGGLLEAAQDDVCQAIFIDEVGPMELSGLAFAPALRRIMQLNVLSGKDIYIAIRSSCIAEICSSFGIRSYSVL